MEWFEFDEAHNPFLAANGGIESVDSAPFEDWQQQRALSGSFDRRLFLWDLQTGEACNPMGATGHYDKMT